MDFEVLDDSLVHWLHLACGIWGKIDQCDGFQVGHMGMGCAVVNDQGHFPFFLMELLVKVSYPFLKNDRCHPSFFVVAIQSRQSFHILKTSRFCRFSNDE